MSHAAAKAPLGVTGRVVQAAALAVVVGLPLLASMLVPQMRGTLGVVSAIGFLLLAGTLLSELLELIGLPHLTGYLLAGILGGPYLLGLVDHQTVEQLSPVNTLALALIALAGGAELRMDNLRAQARTLAWATLIQSVGVLVIICGLFLLLARWIPFAQGLAPLALVGAALLWGTLSVTRSPSALLGILSQTRAKGPLTDFSIGFVMSSDIVVVLLLAVVVTVARPMLDPTGQIGFDDFRVLGHELLGSVALGTTMGLIIAAYLRLVGKNLLLVIVALGFGLSEATRYLHLETLLTFMSAGFVVQNLTRQGEKLLHAVEETGSVVYVVFFGTAGAHLDVPLLKAMWPIAIALAGARALTTWGAARLSSRIAGDPPVIRTWGFAPLVSQAGLALGVAVMVERQFPAFKGGFQSMAIGMVAINEMVGPILYKFALERAGEVGAAEHGSGPPPAQLAAASPLTAAEPTPPPPSARGDGAASAT